MAQSVARAETAEQRRAGRGEAVPLRKALTKSGA